MPAINKVKRQSQKKIITNHISDKGLISRTHKEPIPLNNKTNPFKNGQRIRVAISPKKIYKR